MSDEVKPIEAWAKECGASEFDLAGLRHQSFQNTVNAESTKEVFLAALDRFRSTPVGYQVLGVKKGA